MKDTSQIDILEAQLAKIPDKLSRAKDAYLAGVDTVEEYKANKDHLLLEEARIKKHLRELHQKSQRS